MTALLCNFTLKCLIIKIRHKENTITSGNLYDDKHLKEEKDKINKERKEYKTVKQHKIRSEVLPVFLFYF